MTAADSQRAAELSIRGKPVPVRRFSKKAIMIIFGGASALVLGTFALAMKSPSERGQRASSELYSTANKPTADGLNELPVSYRDLNQDVPILGPALPGDLGAPILKAQREGRIVLGDRPVDLPPEDPERIANQDAEMARKVAARESELFFTRPANGAGQALKRQSAVLPANAVSDPVDPLSLLDQFTQGASSFEDPGLQTRKQGFLGDVDDSNVYNRHRIEMPRSPWQIMAGTVIPASLITAINSDLPGQVIGQVTEPVYDTVTGNTLLIPQGSRLIGRYDSLIAYGQSRALIVWHRIIMPDGTSIQIDNLPAVDGRGQAGLKDKVNHHGLRVFSAAALSTLISIGAELGEYDDDDIARALREAGQDGAARLGDEVVRRQLNVQPTLTVRPGWRFRILVHQDVILQPYGAR